MTLKPIALALLAGLAAAVAAAPAAATTFFYSDKALFLAAAGALDLESFETPSFKTSDLAEYPSASVSCAFEANCLEYDNIGVVPTDGQHTVGATGRSGITFTTAAPIHAFGIDVIGAGTAYRPTTISLAIPQASAALHLDYEDDFFVKPPLFVGVIDTDGFSSARVFGTDDADFIGYDSMLFSSAAGGVPEAASWALMITGFGLAGATLRRRRALLAAS